MNEQINTGGPAFPISLPGWGDNGASGMSLRDYFAAKAMQASLSYGNIGYTITAEDAYRMADAMLKAREQ